MSSCQHGVKESAVMKSEASKSKRCLGINSKELEEFVKEFDFLANKLYSKFCKGKFCTNCKLYSKKSGFILTRLNMTIETLEEKGK